SGVKPLCDCTFTLACFSTRSFTTSSWPASDAMCRAVFPFCTLTLAPRLSSSLTTFTWPSLAARWRAFSP
ncbi:unnamed protein product, partial [Ixodes persulcatus]